MVDVKGTMARSDSNFYPQNSFHKPPLVVLDKQHTTSE